MSILSSCDLCFNFTGMPSCVSGSFHILETNYQGLLFFFLREIQPTGHSLSCIDVFQACFPNKKLSKHTKPAVESFIIFELWLSSRS